MFRGRGGRAEHQVGQDVGRRQRGQAFQADLGVGHGAVHGEHQGDVIHFVNGVALYGCGFAGHAGHPQQGLFHGEDPFLDVQGAF